MTQTNTSGDDISRMIAAIVGLESPQLVSVQRILGGSWTTVQRDAAREHQLASASELRGVRNLSFTEYLLSKRDLAQIAVHVTSDPGGAHAARELRALFGPWTPDHDPLPSAAADGTRPNPSALPLVKEVCRIGSHTVLTIKSYGDGRPDAIYVRWTR